MYAAIYVKSQLLSYELERQRNVFWKSAEKTTFVAYFCNVNYFVLQLCVYPSVARNLV